MPVAASSALFSAELFQPQGRKSGFLIPFTKGSLLDRFRLVTPEVFSSSFGEAPFTLSLLDNADFESIQSVIQSDDPGSSGDVAGVFARSSNSVVLVVPLQGM